MSRPGLRSWTLSRRVAALFTAAGVVLVGIGALAATTAVESNEQLDVILEQTGPMRVAGQELYSAYLDQETGVRGFALSRSAENLRPYSEGRAAETRLLNQLDTLNAEHGRKSIQEDLDVVRQRAEEWRRAVAEPAIAAARGGGPAGGQVDTASFDRLRGAVDDLQNDIFVLRNEAAAAARRTGSVLVALVISAGAVVVVVGLFMLVLLNRLVSRPVTDLAGQVRQVADGDFDRPIAGEGSPELDSLAADVDRMRRRIVDELAEVRVARAQVETVNEELTRSNRDLEQFAYVASHDLQEPLRKVASFCQLLQRRYAGQLDDRADQYIGFAVDGAQRMQRLINDLLAFSRIGRITAGFKTVDLDKVLSDATAQLDTHGGEVTWADLPTVEGEEPLLTTLFVNLVGNSIKFRRPGVAPSVHVTADREDDFWRVNVRDNGIGIEREFADKVFVIFQRLHPRDAYEGTGIGLAIVKKIVEYHGGRIWLDLDAEVGASIWFTLPATVASEADQVEEELQSS